MPSFRGRSEWRLSGCWLYGLWSTRSTGKDSLGFLKSYSIGEFTLAFQHCSWYKLPVYTADWPLFCFCALSVLLCGCDECYCQLGCPWFVHFDTTGAYNSQVVFLICDDSYNLRIMWYHCLLLRQDLFQSTVDSMIYQSISFRQESRV